MPRAGEHPNASRSTAVRKATEYALQGTTSSRHVCFACLCVLSGIAFLHPLSSLVRLASRSDYYSHTVVMPLLAGCLIYWGRNRTFVKEQPGLRAGLPLLLFGAFLFVLQEWVLSSHSQQGRLPLAVFAIVLFWIGAFALCYGQRTLRSALFPLLLLLLMIPLPMAAMNDFIHLTRVGSAEVASLIFSAVGVPFFREDFLFVLPGLSIEIAKQCSGIHSTIALFVLTLMAGYLCLRQSWKRVLLLLFVFPIVSLTNGLRIASLTLLAEYVDKNIFSTNLHRNGGILFFLIAFGLIVTILRFFRKHSEITPAVPVQIASASGTPASHT